MNHAGFDLAAFRTAIHNGAVEWKRHMLEKIVERGIRRAGVLNVLLSGERIEDYPTDLPYPSVLFLGWIGSRPLHVVAAYCAETSMVYVITSYEPDLGHFEPDFRTRRSKS